MKSDTTSLYPNIVQDIIANVTHDIQDLPISLVALARKGLTMISEPMPGKNLDIGNVGCGNKAIRYIRFDIGSDIGALS